MVKVEAETMERLRVWYNSQAREKADISIIYAEAR